MTPDIQAVDHLAASYALGTLRGPARRRFEALCARHEPAATARAAWEARLADLAQRAAPVEPGATTWTAILLRIGHRSAGSATVPDYPVPRPRRSRWQQLAVAASLMVLAGSLGWFAAGQRTVVPVAAPVLSAVITDQAGRPLWRVAASAGLRRLEITVLGEEPVADDRSLELWALPGNGGTPVSLGLIPRSRALSVTLLEPQRVALQSASQVAVSLEPRGGSPGPGPTGPVVHVAALTRS